MLSADSQGDLAASSDFTFATSANTSAPPVISDVNATSVNATSATINWTTDVAANSQVAYGTTAAYGSTTTLVTSLTTTHAVNLTGLSPSTTYHYQVRSSDAQGDLAASSDFTFTTSSASGMLVQLQMHLDATEVSGITNGSVVTPSTRPQVLQAVLS